MVRVRFAPSPTGALHIGGARTALFNYLLVRKLGGKFVLRIDDTDRERSLVEYETDIKAGLEWLGLAWDEGPDIGGEHAPYRQSERQAKHIAAAELLLSKNLAYRDSEGTIRLRYPDADIVVEDVICGRCVFHPNSLGPEVILVRSDGTPTYHLASVSDDIEMQITHVIRGQDHLTNTAKHVVLYHGLGVAEPIWAHLPLILGEDGSKLSKRNSSGMTTVQEFRDAGYLSEALINFLLLLGWSHPDALEHIPLEEAIRAFALERTGKTASVFETARLNYLNGWWIRHLPVETIAAHIRGFIAEYEPVIQSRGPQYWLQAAAFIREEIGMLGEARKLAALLFSVETELTPAAVARFSDPALGEATKKTIADWIALLGNTPIEGPSEYYSKEEFTKLLASLKKTATGEKKTLFQALRIAVTGDLVGPELNVAVPLIPRDTLLARAKDVLKLGTAA